MYTNNNKKKWENCTFGSSPKYTVVLLGASLMQHERYVQLSFCIQDGMGWDVHIW